MNLSEKLSPNFTLEEMLRSETAVRHGYKEQFQPSQEVIDNLRSLCTVILQPVRDYLEKLYPGKKVRMKITCGYRCPRVNKKVGGSATSEHMKGMAADCELYIDGVEYNQVLFDAVVKLNLPYGQLIDEYGTDECPAWIHISYNRNHIRRQKLRAEKVLQPNNKLKTVYTVI